MYETKGNISSPLGFSADGLHAGFKKRKKDFGWIVSEVPASVAAAYTTNKVIAAPLIVTKTSIQANHKIQAIVVNSGIANSCTGEQGMKDAKFMQSLTASKLKIEPNLVAVASTGIIGKMLPLDKLKNGLNKIVINGNSEDFAEAILTTDTFTKTCVVKELFDNDEVTMAGVAKGSGMIHPNMATMLAFITCDANISSETLQFALRQTLQKTFNQITVDGDTSTNDMVLLMSNGCTDNKEIKLNTPEYDKFLNMLEFVMTKLAKLIAKDGEGATKLIEVIVEGVNNDNLARMIAKNIVGSNLVKAALFGEDPNWGRIVTAIGYTDGDFNVNNVNIQIENIKVMKQSKPIKHDLDELLERLTSNEIHIKVNLNQGKASGTAWGCDLSYDYVKINALYHT